MERKTEALKKYFGHGEFRVGQGELVDALLCGRDVLGVMPTGAGKSVCYQLPAVLSDGVAIVISPLISLMKDQVTALNAAGIPAAYINSSLTPAQQSEVFRRAQLGAYKIIYVAPERLEVHGFLAFAREAEISLIAVDEAHCVSQWGQDFRPSYLKIAQFISRLPKRPAVGAFTATATARVKADIEKLLHLCDPVRITTGFDRPNLYFEVVQTKRKDAHLRKFLNERKNQSGIIYCATRKAVEKVCAALQESGISATRYHAGLEDEERRENQEDFIYDNRRVMVATNAFGMGIDKSNVSFVVHYNMPKDIESYYQEAGRAGRDGAPARCTLLFSEGDVATARYLINNSQENEMLTREEAEIVHEQDMRRLDAMVSYCKTTRCLRGYLLGYFGEQAEEKCGACGNCDMNVCEEDVTLQAQKIISAVARAEGRFASGLGVTLIVRMLCGSREKRVLELGLDQLPTYGIMRGVERSAVREYIRCLTDMGYLRVTDGEFPVLRTTERSREVLFEGRRVMRAVRRAAKPAPEKGAAADALFDALKALRRSCAKRARLPEDMVFTNATLADMAKKRPKTRAELLEVSGVGQAKAERYGDEFLNEIQNWQKTTNGGLQ